MPIVHRSIVPLAVWLAVLGPAPSRDGGGGGGSVAAPLAPSNLTASATPTGIILAWADNSINELGFRIESRTLSGGLSFVQIAQIGSNGTRRGSYTVVTRPTKMGYEFRVRAFDRFGNSAYSNVARFSAAGLPSGLPATPTNLVATAATRSSISVSWTDNSSNEASFMVERAVAFESFEPVATVGAGVHVYSDAGLGTGVLHHYRVRARNGAGDSPWSNVLDASTRLAAPTNVAATAASASQFNLSWQAPSGPRTGFVIERGGAGSTAPAPYRTVASTATTFQDTGLPAATAFTYRVRAVNSGFPSIGALGEPSATVSATTQSTAPPPLPPAAPAAPTNLVATAVSSTQINVSWTAASGAAGYRIERAPAGGGFGQVATVGASPTSFQNSGLTPSTTFSYRVVATNSGGSSPASNTASATTPASAPVTVTASVTLDASMQTSSDNPGAAGTSFENNADEVGCNFVQVGTSSGFICGSFALRFDGLQSQIAGRTIASASLQLTVRTLPADRNTTYLVRPFVSDWSSGITFSTAPNVLQSPASSFSPPSTVSVSVDVTSIVRAWANGTIPNFGLGVLDQAMLQPFPTGNILRSTSFHSTETSAGSAPRLVITMQ